MSVDMVLRGYTQDEVDSFLTESDVFEIKIDQPVQTRVGGEVGDIYIGSSRLYVAIEKDTWKSIAYAVESRVSGSSGDIYISEDANFFYACIQDDSWAKIPLVPSSLGFTGYNVKDTVPTARFLHVYTTLGWRKFPLTTVNFEDLVLEEAFQLANNITFEINRAQ